jgi:hypothetical protein
MSNNNDSSNHKGTFVGFLPSKDDCELLHDPDGLEIDDLHLTLRYWPVEVVSDELVEKLHATAVSLAETMEPFVVDVNDTGTLGKENPPAAVLYLEDHDAFSIARDELPSSESDYPSFTPHVTIGYGLDPDDFDVDPRVTFDRIAVVRGQDRHEYPLGVITAAASKKKQQPAQQQEPTKLSEAQMQQRRDAAQKSADARRQAKAPELAERWKNLTPEQRGAMLFFLQQATVDRKKEIQDILKQEVDDAKRADLEGEERDLDSVLDQPDLLQQKLAENAEQERSDAEKRKTARKQLAREIKDLQVQRSETKGMVEKMNLGAQIRRAQIKVSALDADDDKAAERIAAARAEVDRMKTGKNEAAKAHRITARDQAQVARSNREKEIIAKKLAADMKKLAAEQKRRENEAKRLAKKAESDKKKAEKKAEDKKWFSG